MKIKYSPQRSDKRILYSFYGEELHCRLIKLVNNQNVEFEDTFDFTDIPDGKLENVETTLPINPIVSAERNNGELFIELLYYHGANATQEELFPQWQVIE